MSHVDRVVREVLSEYSCSWVVQFVNVVLKPTTNSLQHVWVVAIHAWDNYEYVPLLFYKRWNANKVESQFLVTSLIRSPLQYGQICSVPKVDLHCKSRTFNLTRLSPKQELIWLRTRMHTISRQFIPLIYRPLKEYFLKSNLFCPLTSVKSCPLVNAVASPLM